MTIVTAGEVVVDWLATVKGDTFQDATSFRRGLGGNATNVAVGLCRLGTPARLLAKIGRDIHGQYLKEKLEAEGLDLKYLLVDEQVPSAQCYGFEDLSGEHIYYNWPQPHAAQMLRMEDVVPEVFAGARFLHTTGISFMLDPRKSAIEKAMVLAKQQGLIVSFDANSPKEIGYESWTMMERAFQLAHLLKFNQLELIYWSKAGPSETLEAAAQRLFDRYAPIALAITRGSEGSFLVTAKGIVHCHPLPVDAVCGVAAGDGFVAGMLHTLLKEAGPELDLQKLQGMDIACWHRAGLYGNAVGALVATKPGASQAFPYAHQVESLLQDNAWERLHK